MSNRAWMPLHIADYLSDTGHLTAAEHGAYLLLIMHYWQNGSLPENERLIARIAKLDATQWEESRDVLAMLFGPGWTHRRIDAEMAKADDIIEKRRNAAEARHKKTNRPASAEQVQCTSNDTRVPTDNLQQVKEEPSGSSKKRGRRLPEDWAIPDEYRSVAIEMGLPPELVDVEAAKIRDWSRSSNNGAKLDWLAAWRNWVRSAIERLPRQRGSPSHTPPQPRGSDWFFQSAAQDIADEQRRQAEGEGRDWGNADGVPLITSQYRAANG